MQLTPRAWKLVVIVLPIVILLYVGPEYLWPYIEGLGQQHADLEKKKEFLARYRGRLASKDAYQARLEDNRRRLDSYNVRFLSASEPSQGSASLLEILTKVAADAGLVLTRKEFQSAKRLNPDYQRISAKIDATCSPEQLVLFLAALRNQERYLVIDELTLRSTNIRNNFQLMPTLQVSAIMRSPEVKEEKGAKAKPAPGVLQ